MTNKQKFVRFPSELFHIIIVVLILFLVSFCWKMHSISKKLQNEYELLKDMDQQMLSVNFSMTPTFAKEKMIHIATTVCSSKSYKKFTQPREGAAILIKSVIISALIYNVPELTFHLFLQNYKKDSNYFSNLKFDKHFDRNVLVVKLYFYSLTESIPEEYRRNILDKNIYCLYNKLFLSSVLTNLDAVLYLESSMIIVENISMIWDQFNGMHSYELLGVAVVPEPYSTRDHKNMKAHTKGMNSNLLFMNLTRMRKNHWQNNFLHLYQQGRRQLGYFITDKQLVDTLLYYGTDFIMPITCQFNFIMSTESCCVHAEKDTFGIRAIYPDFNSSSSLETFQLIHDLVKSVYKGVRSNSITNHQDAIMTPLRKVVSSTLGNRTLKLERNTTTKSSKSGKKPKCDVPIYKLIFPQFFA